MIDLAKWNEVIAHSANAIANHWFTGRRRFTGRLRPVLGAGLLCVSGLSSIASCTIFAQGPFGASEPALAADPFGNVPSPASAASEPALPESTLTVSDSATKGEKDLDSMVRLLRLSPPETPRDYAQALDLMSRIRNWDEVAHTFSALQKANWNREQLSELSTLGGPALWSRLSDRDSQLPEPLKKFARDVAVVPSQLARDPMWIDKMIDRLASTSSAYRHAATLLLQRSHRTGIERLCARLLAGDATVPGVRMVEALLRFDNDGIEALRSACISRDSASRARVLLALAQSGSSEFSMELSSALECMLLSDQARRAIGDQLLKRYAGLPSSAKVREYLVMRFNRQLEEYQQARTRSARVPTTIWRMDADGRIVSVDGSPAEKALEGLARMASLRLACSSRTQEDLLDCATVLLQRGYHVQPGIESSETAGQLLSALPEEARGSEFWKKVFDRSESLQMHGAAIRATQFIGRELADSPPGSSSFNFIARALRDSRPVIRYVAVEAMSRAELQIDYADSADALATALEMSRLGEGPTVLVVGLTADLRLAAENQLLSMGSPSLSANSLSSALEFLSKPNPVEMIMVVDRVPGYTLRGLVERLRHSRRGQALPVAILTEPSEMAEANELSRMPGVVLSVLSHEKEQMPRVVREMERRMDVRPLNSAERMLFLESAQRLLEKSSPDQLGTADSQEQWIRIAADTRSSREARMQAADAFSRSIKRYGLLLPLASQLKAYEIYNLQGPSDSVTVAALGAILDAMESITGRGDQAPAP